MGGLSDHQKRQSPPAFCLPVTPDIYQHTEERPQTTAYGLCDSPAGLLAYILDALKPGPIQMPKSPAPSLDLGDMHTPWTPTALLNHTMLYWLPGPEVALRWLVNSSSLSPALWETRSNVLLGISHFRDTSIPSTGTGACPPQWADAYHRLAFIRRREGRVRCPAWERPHDLVEDIREVGRAILGKPSPGSSSAGSGFGDRTVAMSDVQC